MKTLLSRLGRFDRLRLCFAMTLCLCLICDFFLARATIPTSDTVQNYNEMFAFQDGNILLKNWVLVSDNFYFTDLPFYLVASLLFGTSTNLIFIVPFLVFCTLLVGCFLLVANAAETRAQRYAGAFAVLLLTGIQFSTAPNLFLLSAIHIATVTLCLYALLIVQPILSGRPTRLVMLIPFGLLVFAISFSDPAAIGFFLGPLLLLLILRLWLRPQFRLGDALLAVAILLGLLAASAFFGFLAAEGGFRTQSSFALGFVPSIDAMEHSIEAVIAAVRILFSIEPPRLQGLAAKHVFEKTRLITTIIVTLLCLRALWRLPRAPQNATAQCLILGALCFAVLDSLSQSFAHTISEGSNFPAAAIRYVTPIYIFMSLAAILEALPLVSRIRSAAIKRWILIIGLGFGVIYVAAGAQKAAIAARMPVGLADFTQLTDWLEQHHFRYGVGDYWVTQMVLAASQGRVLADPVSLQLGQLRSLNWICDTSRLDRGDPPQFVVYRPGNVFGVTPEAVAATYGTPIQRYDVAAFVVLQLRAP